MKLLKTDTLEEAILKLNNVSKRPEKSLKSEFVSLYATYDRTLAENVYAAEDVPGFDRSVVDGYAVKSSDTGGATESMPTFLKCVGEVEMGEMPKVAITSGECMYVPTGGMLPIGADSVVMVEYSEIFAEDQVAIYQAVSEGRGMASKGDDCKRGELLLEKGRVIKAAEMGLLASAGLAEVPVYKKTKVCIISTGDELVQPGEEMKLGQVRDINTYALLGAASELGFDIVKTLALKDDRDLLKREVIEAMKVADIVAISGGSSQGKKDATESIIDEVCSSGVLTHGIAIKPGKPTITGYDEPSDTVVIGLPGHPAAALIIFNEFFGRKGEVISAKMTTNAPSAAGRKTIQLVKLDIENGEYIATPIFSKSGMINAVVKADGYVLTDINSEGINKGEMVEVYRIK